MPQNTPFGTQARRALADYPPGQRLAFAVNRDGAILGRAASGDHAGLKVLRDCEIVEAWIDATGELNVATGRICQPCAIEIDAGRV